MDGREGYIRALRATALGPLGISGEQERIWGRQTTTAHQSNALLQLPVDTSEYLPIQNADGSLIFMMDRDGLDGGNGLG